MNKVKKNSYHLFTEVAFCSKIGYHALKSFRKYHPDEPVHVYGRLEDFACLSEIPRLIFHPLKSFLNYGETILGNIYFQLFGKISAGIILDGFKKGHLGTALLWSNIIIDLKEDYFIHFDSDVIFRGNVLNDILDKIDKGFDLIGRYRNYKHNPQNIEEIRYLPDVCQTVLFGFRRDKISKHPNSELVQMSLGFRNPLGHKTIDFFDPIMFEILHNGGKISFLDFNIYGGCNELGKRDNKYQDINSIIDFGSKFAHFSSVGSGVYYDQHPDTKATVDSIYRSYALDKYGLYMKIFYGQDRKDITDYSKYKKLFEVKSWY